MHSRDGRVRRLLWHALTYTPRASLLLLQKAQIRHLPVCCGGHKASGVSARAPLHVVDVVVIKSLNLCVNGEEINLRSLMSLLISHQNAPNFNRYFICHFTLVYFVGLFA